MKIIGIIAEYNPFHNGHLYQRKAEKRKKRKLLNLSIKSNDKEKFYLNESKTNNPDNK